MKKKVLFLIHTLAGGGAERVLVNLVNNIDRNLYDITVMTVFNTGIYINELSEDITYKAIFGGKKGKPQPKPESNGKTSSGVLKAQSKLRGILDFFYTKTVSLFSAKCLYKMFIKEHYDTEIAFLEGICTKIISGGDKNDGTKRVAWVHVDIINQPRSSKFYLTKKQERNAYKRLDDIICVSQGVKDSVIAKFGSDITCNVKYNPVSSEEIKQQASESVAFDKTDKGLNFVTVGRLIPQKGYDRMLRVHNRLISEGYKYKLFFIGEGPDRDSMISYIEKNNLGGYTELLGYQTNPHKFVSQCDAFVCSSRAEGFSTVATEAVIIGTPIVTVNCSGMGELLQDGKYGLITNNTEDELYEGLKQVLDDNTILLKYKEMLPERAKDFSLEKAVSSIQEVI